MKDQAERAPSGACLHCGAEFQQSRNRRKKFCSQYCNQEHWRIKNAERHRERSLNGYYKSRIVEPKRAMLNAAKRRAKQKGIPFNLTLEDISIPDYCPVLGIPLEIGKGAATDGSPSLDRIMPAMGYVKGNVIVISWRANRLKSDGLPDEHRRIANFFEHHIKTDWMKQ